VISLMVKILVHTLMTMSSPSSSSVSSHKYGARSVWSSFFSLPSYSLSFVYFTLLLQTSLVPQQQYGNLLFVESQSQASSSIFFGTSCYNYTMMDNRTVANLCTQGTVIGPTPDTAAVEAHNGAVTYSGNHSFLFYITGTVHDQDIVPNALKIEMDYNETVCEVELNEIKCSACAVCPGDENLNDHDVSISLNCSNANPKFGISLPCTPVLNYVNGTDHIKPILPFDFSAMEFEPSDDTWLDPVHPNTNYAGSDTIKFSRQDRYGLMKFSITGITTGPEVANAVLELYTTSTYRDISHTNVDSISVYYVRRNTENVVDNISYDEWQENDVTFNTPKLGNTLRSKVGVHNYVQPETIYSFNITETVREHGSGTYNFRIQSDTAGVVYSIYSKEAAEIKRPKIHVNLK